MNPDSPQSLDGTLLSTRAAETAVASGPVQYVGAAPFSPDEPIPEYPFQHCVASDQGSSVYRTVREALRLLRLDDDRVDQPDWNPLSSMISPGDTVVIKPNFVRDFRESDASDADCVITHGAVIRAIVDYVYIALHGEGRIVIADAPHNDADFNGIRRITQVDRIQQFYREAADFDLEVYDLRPEAARKVDGVIVGHDRLKGDPAGYVKVNLGSDSAFAEINHLCHLLYGSEYDMSELHSHQHDDVHEYLISKTILDADVVISLPKFKTHKKVGLTVNMKNLVGINGNKNWLPHHREGTPSQGGDQFADDNVKHKLERSTVAQFKRLFPILGPLRPIVAGPIKAMGKRIFGDTNVDAIRSGNWYGNDTTWRMVLDLNRILHYARNDGRLETRPVRKFFSLVDGIIAGEGNGPLDPIAKPCGVIIAGFNPLAVDLTCARLMGFDYERIPMLLRGLELHAYPLANFKYEDVAIRSDRPAFDGRLSQLNGPLLAFRPHFGWAGHIELTESANEAGALA